MTYELDHIIILTDVGARVADKLVTAGIIEGTSRVHIGQGTTNRRFFFNNSMIECLWVHDEDEVTHDRTRPTMLLPRWQGRLKTASPFGICFRPIGSAQPPSPFPSWDYNPLYLPEGHTIQIANTVKQVEEPFLFYAPWINAPDTQVVHPAGMENITAVHVTHPYTDLTSPSIDAIQHIVTIEAGDAHRLTVTFDDHRQGKTLDFQPDLPLVIHC